MEIYFCEDCQRRVSDGELAAGDAVHDGDSVFCKPCALKLGIYQRAREEVEELEEAPVPRTRSRRRQAPPTAAGLGGQNLVYLACGVGVAVITALVVIIVQKRGRSERVGGPVRPVLRAPLAPAPRPAIAPVPPPPEKTPAPPVQEKPAPPPSPRPSLVPKPPPPRPVPKPPSPPAPALQPVEEGWKSIFNGRDMKGWRHEGGKAHVEDGALVSTGGADVYYKAGWAEFTLACELKAGGGEAANLMAVGLAQSGTGRGRSRVRITFHNDGDVHVYGAKKRLWKSGGGKFPLTDWTPVKLELRKDKLEIYKGDKLMGTANLSQVPMQKGGVYFYSYRDNTARMRNVRVRVASR